jgi:transposase
MELGKRSSKGRSQIRARRDREAMEKRRKQAAKLFRQGLNQAEVARELEVSRQSASRWHRAWRDGGASALKMAERAGRPPLLKKAGLKKVEARLLKGAEANGFESDLWTLERVAKVIEMVSGVDYHPAHVWRLLKQMGWSLQKPARRALERDEQAIGRWVKEKWPEVKKTQSGKGLGSSSKTNRGIRSYLSSAERGLLVDRPQF